MTDQPSAGAGRPDPMPTPPADPQGLEPGYILAGRYRILELLGVGAMGAVYLAEHVRIGRKDAIKVLKDDLAGDREAIARFTRGARNVSAIRHPNICTIYDFSDTDDGVTFLAMEYVPGESLRDVLEREGALPLERAVHIAMQSALALQAAHDAGIVHRDLKPANIMISRGKDGLDAVKVVDFDIAKGPAEGGGEEVTRLGFVVGTPEYMSPEQLMGEALDGRSDLYSLALVFFRMLTGALPFQADNTQDLMIKRLTEQPLRLDAVRPDLAFPPALQAVLDRALQRKAADRHASAAAFAEDLALAVRGGAARSAPDLMAGAGARTAPPAEPEPVPPTRIAPPPATPRAAPTAAARPPRSTLYRAGAGAGAVVVVLLAVFLFTRWRGEEPDGLATGDTETPVESVSTGGEDAPPGDPTTAPEGASQAQDPTTLHPPAQDPQRQPSSPADGGRTTSPTAGTGEERRSPTAPDPALAARQDSLVLWRQFERLGSANLSDAVLGAIVDSARTLYGKSALPATHRAFAAYIAGLASVELGDMAGCAAWLERAVRLRPDGPGYQEQLDACREPEA